MEAQAVMRKSVRKKEGRLRAKPPFKVRETPFKSEKKSEWVLNQGKSVINESDSDFRRNLFKARKPRSNYTLKFKHDYNLLHFLLPSLPHFCYCYSRYDRPVLQHHVHWPACKKERENRKNRPQTRVEQRVLELERVERIASPSFSSGNEQVV